MFSRSCIYWLCIFQNLPGHFPSWHLRGPIDNHSLWHIFNLPAIYLQSRPNFRCGCARIGLFIPILKFPQMGRTGDGNSRTDCGLSPDSSLLADKRTPVDRAKHETLIGSILRKKDPRVFEKLIHPVRFAPIWHLLYSQQYSPPLPAFHWQRSAKLMPCRKVSPFPKIPNHS
jgi:hypothetical protein